MHLIYYMCDFVSIAFIGLLSTVWGCGSELIILEYLTRSTVKSNVKFNVGCNLHCCVNSWQFYKISRCWWMPLVGNKNGMLGYSASPKQSESYVHPNLGYWCSEPSPLICSKIYEVDSHQQAPTNIHLFIQIQQKPEFYKLANASWEQLCWNPWMSNLIKVVGLCFSKMWVSTCKRMITKTMVVFNSNG